MHHVSSDTQSALSNQGKSPLDYLRTEAQRAFKFSTDIMELAAEAIDPDLKPTPHIQSIADIEDPAMQLRLNEPAKPQPWNDQSKDDDRRIALANEQLANRETFIEGEYDVNLVCFSDILVSKEVSDDQKVEVLQASLGHVGIEVKDPEIIKVLLENFNKLKEFAEKPRRLKKISPEGSREGLRPLYYIGERRLLVESVEDAREEERLKDSTEPKDHLKRYLSVNNAKVWETVIEALIEEGKLEKKDGGLSKGGFHEQSYEELAVRFDFGSKKVNLIPGIRELIEELESKKAARTEGFLSPKDVMASAKEAPEQLRKEIDEGKSDVTLVTRQEIIKENPHSGLRMGLILDSNDYDPYLILAAFAHGRMDPPESLSDIGFVPDFCLWSHQVGFSRENIGFFDNLIKQLDQDPAKIGVGNVVVIGANPNVNVEARRKGHRVIEYRGDATLNAPVREDPRDDFDPHAVVYDMSDVKYRLAARKGVNPPDGALRFDRKKAEQQPVEGRLPISP